MTHRIVPVPRRAAAALALLAAACSGPSGVPDEPSPSARPAVAAEDSLPTALTSTVRPPRAGEQLPPVSFTGGAGEVAIRWELRSGPCMLATPEARRADGEIVVSVTRGGDPVALCVAGEVVYRYDITVRGVPAGRHRVRLVERPVEQPARDVAAGEVAVRAPGA